MASYNRTIMTGRVATEPEMHTLKSGTQVIKFVLAVDNIKKKGKDKTCEFIPHEGFGNIAKAMNEHLKKGMLVQTEGHLHGSTYMKDGTKRMVWKIVAEWVGFLAWPKGNCEPEPELDIPGDFQHEYNEDDLPF